MQEQFYESHVEKQREWNKHVSFGGGKQWNGKKSLKRPKPLDRRSCE